MRVREYLAILAELRGWMQRGRAGHPDAEALRDRAVRLFEQMDNDERREAVAELRERGKRAEEDREETGSEEAAYQARRRGYFAAGVSVAGGAGREPG